MQRDLSLVVAVVIMGLTTFSCSRAPLEESSHDGDDASSSALPTHLPLIDIMRGLETDLAGAAHGIWTRDPEAVRMSAIRVAEHPQVTPDQLSTIRDELGSEFGVFAQYDKVVHNTALELATAVDSSSSLANLFAIYLRVEQGCMSCHTAFQKRVSEALIEATTVSTTE
jgi:hypothetical protein